MLRTLSTRVLLSFTLVGMTALGAAGCCCCGGGGGGGASEKAEGAAPLCSDACVTAQSKCDASCKGDERCADSCSETQRSCLKICAAHEKNR